MPVVNGKHLKYNVANVAKAKKMKKQGAKVSFKLSDVGKKNY